MPLSACVKQWFCLPQATTFLMLVATVATAGSSTLSFYLDRIAVSKSSPFDTHWEGASTDAKALHLEISNEVHSGESKRVAPGPLSRPP
jgi:hypothetical protein